MPFVPGRFLTSLFVVVACLPAFAQESRPKSVKVRGRLVLPRGVGPGAFDLDVHTRQSGSHETLDSDEFTLWVDSDGATIEIRLKAPYGRVGRTPGRPQNQRMEPDSS
jgi:hypothetical protein